MIDFDNGHPGYPIGANENLRRQALLDLAILDTPSEPQFEALVDLGCKAFGVPICHISFIDADRQWFKAIRGIPLHDVPRGRAFCNHTIAQNDPVVCEDASTDLRFASHPMVTSDDGLRFYASVPIRTADGHAVGTFCILDTKPRQLTSEEQAALEGMARIAEALVQQFDDANKRLALAQQVEAHNTLVAVQRGQLDRQTHLMSQASSMARMGAWERDLRTGSYIWSPGMYRLHEIDESFPVTEESTLAFYPPGERRRARKVIELAKRSGAPYQIDLQILTGKGNRRWMRVTSNLETVDGVPLRRFGMMQDITEEKDTADRLAFMAERDALTGLYNRSFLRDRIDGLASQPGAGSQALLLLDLDGFKDVNDTHGHAAGDECLRRIARRLTRAAGKSGLVSRIGGDEFAILLDLRGGRMDAPSLARHIRTLMQAPVRWRGQSFQLSASIGIAYRTANSAIGSEELLRDADLALYDAKAAGKNCEAVYRVELKAEVTRRFAIVRDVGRALRRGRLSLYYQPKIGLADRSHNGFEALLRWTRDDGTVVAAGAFEPALRDPGLSVEIGNFVLESALNQAACWRAEQIDFRSIAINLGASQFRNPNLGRAMLARCAELGVPPAMIEVEVTEDVFMSRAAGHALEVCRELKSGGMRIAFDDFGTGFASLTHLREFPVDVLKIDRSFISRLGTDTSTTSIVHAVIDLAHNLDLTVVAEGVETEGQAQFLRAVGCELAQGYLYARPMPALAVPAYLGADLRLTA